MKNFFNVSLIVAGCVAVGLSHVTEVRAGEWVANGSNIYLDDGRLGVLVENPQSLIDAYSPDYSVFRLTSSSDLGWKGNFYLLQRSGGTKGAPNAVSDGDKIGYFDFWGHDGNAFVRSSQMRIAVDGAPGSGFVPSSVEFLTTDPAGNYSQRMIITSEGNVGIGTGAPTNELEVNGTIRAKEILVEATSWPDYVFTKDYNLMPLDKIDEYVKTYGHLPGMPSQKVVLEKGVDIGKTTVSLLEKVEELTLHVIELKKENDRLKEKVENLALND